MRDIYKVIGAVLLVIVAVLGIGAALHIFMSLPFDATGPNDKRAEWTAAWGTIGTLLGTIWIATSESRKRAREERYRSLIAAASIHFQIRKGEALMEIIVEELQAISTNPVNGVPLDYLLTTIERMPPFHADTLLQLVPLGKIAFALSHVQGRIDAAKMIIGFEIERPAGDQQRGSTATASLRALSPVPKMLESIASEMKSSIGSVFTPEVGEH